MKAGILEIGDIFVVNKADLDGSEGMAQEIRAMVRWGKMKWLGYPPDIMGLEGLREVRKELEDGGRQF